MTCQFLKIAQISLAIHVPVRHSELDQPPIGVNYFWQQACYQPAVPCTVVRSRRHMEDCIAVDLEANEIGDLRIREQAFLGVLSQDHVQNDIPVSTIPPAQQAGQTGASKTDVQLIQGTNKKEFKMLTLRNIAVDETDSPEKLKISVVAL